MCGLVGFYPKKNKNVDFDKIYFLTIAIEERGTDSCGISVGNLVYKGSGKKSKSKDFIAEELMYGEFPSDQPVIFHNRSATIKSSLTNEDNIHPFVWENQNSYLAGAHNGTLTEYKDLKTKFCPQYHDSLFNIDSHYLLLSIHANMNNIGEVLESYQGAAALLFYNADNFWAWKGANWGVEERPLYYIEDKNGWYFCSLENPLKIAFKEDPIMVGNNTLMRFSNGKLQQETILERKIISKVVSQVIVRDSSWQDDYKAIMGDVNPYYTTQPFYYSADIFFDVFKKRYVNKDKKLLSGPASVDPNKTVCFEAGQLVQSYTSAGHLHNKIKTIKEHQAQDIAQILLPYITTVIIDFYEVKVNKINIFYFKDLDGEIQWLYDRKSKLADDFTTTINREDCRITSFPKIKLKLYEYEAARYN